MIDCNAKTIKNCLEIAIRSSLVAFIGGSPGIGKSSVVHDLAVEYNLKLIDVRLSQCDPTDMNGMPHIFVEKNKAGYVPMETFPTEGDPLPIRPDGKPYAGWFLFFDELSSAPGAVQAASYKVLLDKYIGIHPLHSKVCIAAAGNLDTDNAIVEEISSALQSRMLHLRMVSDPSAWLELAASKNIDATITSFIKHMPKNLNSFNPAVETVEKTYACERTWFFVDSLIKKGGLDLDDRETARPLIAGCISEGIMTEYLAHTKIYRDLTDIDEIIKKPMTAAIPPVDRPGHMFAMSGCIAQNMNDGNCKSLLQYVDRMPVEYKVITVREALRRTPGLTQNPDAMEWMLDAGEDLW